MDELSGPPVAGGDDDVARLVALTERQHDLWALLRGAQDEAMRNRLLDELSANREELAQLKAKVRAAVNAPRAPRPGSRPEPPPEPPRSVGEELRARILIPEEVAPTSPPPPPAPPPRIVDIPADREVPASPRPAEPDAPAAPRSADEPKATIQPPDESEAPLPQAQLAPEKIPFSSREADLAATRARRAGARQAPPDVPTDATPDAESVAPPAPSPPGPASPRSKRSAKEAERLAAAHAALQDLEKVRPKHVRSFPILAVVVAIIAVAVAIAVWISFF